jgi:P-type Cu+ transporter
LSLQALLQYARERSKDSQFLTVDRFEAIAGSGVKGIVEGREVWIGTQRWFDEMGLDSSAFQVEQQALENAGKTVVFVAVDGHLQSAIAVADNVKPNSAKAIQTLQRMGIEVVMLTGDNQRTAKAADRVGIKRVLAESPPRPKSADDSDFASARKKSCGNGWRRH